MYHVYEYIDWVMDDEIHDWDYRYMVQGWEWFWDWRLMAKGMGMGYTQAVFSVGNLVFVIPFSRF